MSQDEPLQRSGGHPWKRWIAVLFGAATLGVILFVATRYQEPSYAGKTLSQWLAILDTGRFDAVNLQPVPNGEAVQALRAMGSKVVPYLVGNIDSAFAAGKQAQSFGAWPTQLPTRVFGKRIVERIELGQQSLLALSVLGDDAKGAFPLLQSIQVREFSQQQWLLTAMAVSDPAAINIISNALGSQENLTRRAAIEASGYLGTNGAPLVQALVAILSDPQSSKTDRSIAALTLGRIGHPPDKVTAALRSSLSSTNLVLAGNAALGLMMAGVREPEVLNEIAAQIWSSDGRLNSLMLFSLTVLETNDAKLTSLLGQHAIVNPSPKHLPVQVFDEVRRVWTNCDAQSRQQIFSMLNDLISAPRPN